MSLPNVREPEATRASRAVRHWTRALLGAACLVPLNLGCQTTAPWAGGRKPQATPGSTSSSMSNAAQNPTTLSMNRNVAASGKTEFHPKPTPDQQFNVHMELGRVYEAQQQPDAAIAEYEKGLEACSHRGFAGGMKGSGTRQALAHRRLGAAYDRMGRFAQAESHYRTALKLSPDDPKVWNDAGYSYHLQSRWADAERCLKTAAKLAPNDQRIQTNLGLTLAAAGKTDEALAALSKAGGDAVGHANLGYLLAAMGKTDEARQHYQTALALQPKLAAAGQALTALNAKAKHVEQLASIPSLPLPAPAPARVASATPVAPRPADPSVRRTSGPRVTPLSVATPTIGR